MFSLILWISVLKKLSMLFCTYRYYGVHFKFNYIAFEYLVIFSFNREFLEVEQTPLELRKTQRLLLAGFRDPTGCWGLNLHHSLVGCLQGKWSYWQYFCSGPCFWHLYIISEIYIHWGNFIYIMNGEKNCILVETYKLWENILLEFDCIWLLTSVFPFVLSLPGVALKSAWYAPHQKKKSLPI